MKKINTLVQLNFALIFAIALAHLRCPLYKSEKMVWEQPERAQHTDPAEYLDVKVWHSKKANGLTRYHFEYDKITFATWAKDRETAVKKFKRYLYRDRYLG